jgi:hypothetical protein
MSPESNKTSKIIKKATNHPLSSSINHEILLSEPILVEENYITIDITLENESIVNMFEIWFDFNDTEIVSMMAYVKNRNCNLDQRTMRFSNSIAFFICDSRTEYKSLITSNLISISLSAKNESLIKLELIKLIVYQFSNSCGQIERPIFSGIELINGNSTDYEFSCSQKYNFIPIDGSPPDRKWHIYCGSDAQWFGSFPKCKPIYNCPINEKSNEILQIAYKKLLYINDSLSYAVHHFTSFEFMGEEIANKSSSLAIHSCLNSTEKYYKLNGNSHRECMPNGQWSGDQPFCYNLLSFVEQTNENIVNEIMIFSTNTSFRLIIVAMTTVLGFMSISIVVIILCVKSKRRKTKSRKSVPKNEVKSVSYDDIMNNENSQVFYVNENHEQIEEFCELNEDKERVQSCLYEIITENDYEVINFHYENIEISKSNETLNKIYDDTLLSQPIYTVILPSI